MVHSRGPLLHISSSKTPELANLWCFSSWTVPMNALVDHGGFPIRAAINRSWSSPLTPAVHYIVSWQLTTWVWSYSHTLACCFLILQVAVLCTTFQCSSWVILLVAVLAALRWTNWCLHCCSGSVGGELDEVSVVWLDWDPLPPGWGVCGAMTCCCGKGEDDDNEKKWEVLRNI